MLRIVPLLIAGLIVGAEIQAQQKITVKGSDTMVILGQRWASRYMEKNKGIVIQVTGGGSGTGIAALINGTTDICNASRAMKREEREKLRARFGSPGVEIKCAVDGLTVYVHQSNPIKNISMSQLRDIYTGKVTRWSQLGGADTRIVVYGRENNSGTYVFFKEHVLGAADYTASMQSLPGTASVVNAVLKDRNSIGYGGSAYARGIRRLAVRPDDTTAAIEPTPQNIRSGMYPLSRFLFMYVRSRPTGAIKSYIDWILGDEGQKIAETVGYFPIR